MWLILEPQRKNLAYTEIPAKLSKQKKKNVCKNQYIVFFPHSK